MKYLFATFLIMFSACSAIAGFDGHSAVEVLHAGGHGSGVYIGRNYVLTAGHVAEGFATVTVTHPGTSGFWVDSWEANVVWVDKVRDFALLRIKAVSLPDTMPAAVLACKMPELNAPIDIVGWPLNLGRLTTHGYVASDDAVRGPWQHSFVAVAPITFGNSGGPAYDADGKLMGLVVGIVDGTSLSLIAPVAPICDELPK